MQIQDLNLDIQKHIDAKTFILFRDLMIIKGLGFGSDTKYMIKGIAKRLFDFENKFSPELIADCLEELALIWRDLDKSPYYI